MQNRRDFIKISALGFGGLALSGSLYSSLVNNLQTPEEPVFGSIPKLNRYPTYCEICFWKCAAWTYLSPEGEIQKIKGNKNDPHCNGRLCPRGTGGVGMYNDEDRLKAPLIRTGERGKQSFREASWDEAFEYIAKKMQEIAKKYSPESMALFSHGSGGKYFGTLLKAFGSKNISAPSFAQCRGPREVGFLSTFGDIVMSPERIDIRNTKCLVLIGSHLGENMHNGQVQEFSDAIDAGATIITVDPRFSTAASKSKFWLPIKPSTDLALLLTWINIIIREEWYDKDYVEKNTYGFEFLKEEVKNYTPEWAYGITKIEPNVIFQTAREMSNASPAVIIHPGRHVTWYGDDTQRSRAIAILNAILGSWGRRGGFYQPAKVKLPKYPIPAYPKPKNDWRNAFPGQFSLAHEALSSGICDASIPGFQADNNIKGWIVNGTNLMTTIPNQANTLKAIQSLDLLVVIDTMPAEITGYADVVLPECTYLERYDMIRTSPHREPHIALRMPAAEPKYNTKPAWWIAKNLSEKLNLGAYFPWKNIEELLDWQLNKVGSSLKEMQKLGVKKFDREYDDLYFTEGKEQSFATNTGKIELYSTDFEAEGFDPIPKYTSHPEPPEGFYRLIYGRAPMHTFTRTANNPNLVDLMSENSVWINPKTAFEWGFKNGQKIYLKNQDGVVSSFPIKIRVTERIRWDSVYMVHGFGSTQKQMSRAFGSGASDSELITHVMLDPIMGGTGMRGNFVTFLKQKQG